MFLRKRGASRLQRRGVGFVSQSAPLLGGPSATRATEGKGVKKKKKGEVKMQNQTNRFSLRVAVGVPCALERGGSIKAPVPFTDFPTAGCLHWRSFMHLFGKSPCYLSMSHTGPATRLTLPLLLYKSTAPSATAPPPLASFSGIQSRSGGLSV